MDLTFHLGEFDRPDVQALLDFHFAEMRAVSPEDACHVLPLKDLRSAAIDFWAARENGALRGVGALKELDETHGEIKSMRTAPDALGRGVGTAVLDHLISEARRKGFRKLSLETGGSELYAPAIQIYQRAGFTPCGPFASYLPTPFTRFFSCEL